MASPERRRPQQLQLELEDDLITNANALSLLDASDDLLSPSVLSKPAWRLDGDACQSRRGLLLSSAGCSSEESSIATPAPPSDASWPTYAPGPLKVMREPACSQEAAAARLLASFADMTTAADLLVYFDGALCSTLTVHVRKLQHRHM